MTVENLIKDHIHLVKVVVNDFAKSRPHLREDLESDLMFALWRSAQAYDPDRGTKPSTYFNMRLTQEAKDRVDPKCNANASYSNRKVAPTTSSGERMEVEEFLDSVTMYKPFNITKADQRQLIDSLITDPSQVDEVTFRAVTDFTQYDSIRELATALGYNRKKIERRLRKLADNFREEDFGSYKAYLYAS